MVISSDLLVLASAVVPEKSNPLAQMYKVPQNDDGFFAEAHVKLRPNDFATDGVFVCGLAHAPKPIEESIAQAQAAASRAVTVLAALEISVSGMSLWSIQICAAAAAFVWRFVPIRHQNSTKSPVRPKFSPPCAKAAGCVWLPAARERFI